MEFKKRYTKLNEAQKQAVDTIDGPVMVIAGPGTGKTELLSVRVANILQKTDTLPENILCLTFTESGASAMRERLTQIIGKDAYKVAIHTFHSFGSEIINQNGQYFYQGANFHAADSLGSYEIIRKIFDELNYDNIIAKKINDEYTYLSDSLTAISEIKKSGLTSDELLKVLDENQIVIEKVEQSLSPIFDSRIAKSTIDKMSDCIESIRNINPENSSPDIISLSIIIGDSIEIAVNEANETNSTKPITAWKNAWFTKNNNGKFILKSNERQSKLRALCYVYSQYLARMEQASLYDFDDMIMRVVHTIEVNDDLRFNLQEKYQYVMVDEFQDTNMAQMRILHNLTNNEVQGDTPNIMVVGDDDQAIYSFQGADVSNIINFRKQYAKSKIITLTENYRSTSEIIDGSRQIIVQGKNSLEKVFSDIDKKLKSNTTDSGEVLILESESINSERHWLINDIKKRINSGQKPNTIAILTRRHHEINSLLPYFEKYKIAINYERRDNVLDLEPIKLIEQISNVLINMANGHHDQVNAMMPEMLAHKSWRIKPVDLWNLSVKAYDNHTRWLDIMQTMPEFLNISGWLINNAAIINDTSLEEMIDIIVGKPDESIDENQFVSPIYNHYFSNQKLSDNPSKYLTYLEGLRTIRSKLREYHPDEEPKLSTFIEFIRLNRKINNTINISRQSMTSEDSVNVMTVHKSKGLEFDTVYVINVVDNIWGEHARSRNRLINYPENLQLAPAGETDDERLRLFYVAITRARKQLFVSYSLSDDNSKNTLLAGFLLNSKWTVRQIESATDISNQTESVELAWYQPIVHPVTMEMNQILLPRLENYKLSATHLNNFLDISRGGPSAFLINNLLQFPSAKTANASFGTAMHSVLQQAHSDFIITGSEKPIEDIVSSFESILKNQHLSKQDFEIFSQKGSDAIRAFLDKKYSTFSINQKTELNFSGQGSMVDEAKLKGVLDLVDINKTDRTVEVIDYKTGKPFDTWSGKTDYEKIKLHKYKQQLLFYKLLVENARDYRNYKVTSGKIQFVEPDKSGQILSVETEFNNDEIEHFSKLINAVWSHITTLNLPDTSNYEPTIKGIMAFEQDLIDGVI